MRIVVNCNHDGYTSRFDVEKGHIDKDLGEGKGTCINIVGCNVCIGKEVDGQNEAKNKDDD
jgi:hypothetical protein